jgi:MFS family permease
VPLFTIALYYGIANSNHLTQLEPLVGFPLFLSCYWASRAAQSEDRTARFLVLSGLAAGLSTVFKLVLLPIPLGFWLLSAVFTARTKKQSLLHQIFHWAPFILIGALLPALFVFLWFLKAHAVGPLIYASFVYPFEAIRQLQPQQRTGTLALSLQWFVGSFAVLIALAFSTAYMAVVKHKDIFCLNLVLWIVVGFGLIMIQRYSWWEYHFFLLLIPLGILATRAIDDAWIAITALGNSGVVDFASRPRTRRIVFTSCVALLFSPVFASSAVLSLYLVRHRFARTEKDRIGFQRKVNPVYQVIGTDVSFLSDQNSLKGDIFVFGDPRYYYLAGRDQAIPLNGDNPEIMIPDQWMQMETDLARTLPVYVYLSDYLSGEHSSYAHAIVTVINEHYEPLRRGATGTWYMARNRTKSNFVQP